MAKFRRRPLLVEAWLLTEDNGKELVMMINKVVGDRAASLCEGAVDILTLDGPMKASIGDWIIKSVRRGFYPCKGAVFSYFYEAVE